MYKLYICNVQTSMLFWSNFTSTLDLKSHHFARIYITILGHAHSLLFSELKSLFLFNELSLCSDGGNVTVATASKDHTLRMWKVIGVRYCFYN